MLIIDDNHSISVYEAVFSSACFLWPLQRFYLVNNSLYAIGIFQNIGLLCLFTFCAKKGLAKFCNIGLFLSTNIHSLNVSSANKYL